jgi:hypothetical protein
MSTLRMFLTSDMLYIPTFQREYVWTIEDVALLFDSIVKQYPIGNVVVLQDYTGRINIPRKKNVWSMGFEGDLDVEHKRGAYYVLDGQQRMLSLIKLFYTQELHIAILKGSFSLDDLVIIRDEEMDWERYWSVSRGILNSHVLTMIRPILDRMVANGDKYAANVIARDYPEGINWINSYNREFYSALIQDKGSEANKLLHVLENLTMYDIPYYNFIVEGNSTVKEAVAIFKRINMSGVPVDIELLEALDG